MRNILHREESEIKAKKKSRILTFFLLGILVLSSLGYAFLTAIENPSNQETNNDNLAANGRWTEKYGDQTLSFATSTEAVKDVPVISSLTINDYYTKTVYFDIENTGIASEINYVLGPYLARLQEACYGSCEKNLPEKSCSDLMIIWKESETNRVYQNQSCLFIEGDMRAADAFLYNLFGK